MNRVIHEPARLFIVALLSTTEHVDFNYLLHETKMTKGNLSSHLSKLESAGYVSIEKSFRGKIPQTQLRLTASGRRAFASYRAEMKRLMK